MLHLKTICRIHSFCCRKIEETDTEFLTVHRLAVLVKCCPSSDEEEMMRGFKGDISALGKAEKVFLPPPKLHRKLSFFLWQFFVEMIKIERLRPRLAALSAMAKFPENVIEITDAAQVQLLLRCWS